MKAWAALGRPELVGCLIAPIALTFAVHAQTIGGVVVDLKTLKNLAIALASVMSTLVAFIFALSEDADGMPLTDECTLDPLLQEKVREYAQLLAANASCAVNITF